MVEPMPTRRFPFAKIQGVISGRQDAVDGFRHRAMGLAASLGQGLSSAEGETRIGEGQQSQSVVYLLIERVAAQLKGHGYAGGAQQIQIAVEAANVQTEAASNALAR